MQSYPITTKYLGILLLLLGISINVKAQNVVASAISGNTSEDVTSATFTVTLDADPLTSPVSVSLSIPVELQDEISISPSSANLTSSNYSTGEIFTITGVNDGIVDGDKSITITINGDNGITTTSTSVVVINEDNDTSELSISASVQAAEDNSNGSFSILSSVQSETDTEINLTISGTATGDIDYIAVPLSVTLPANSNNTSINIEVLEDIIVEENETVIVTLDGTDNSRITVGSTSQATVTITDNDVATLSVVATTQATEDNSDGLFTISTPATSNSATNITVAISGTATSGTDYTAISTTVLLPANSTSVTVPVEVLADAIVEGDETVILNLVSTDNPEVSVGTTNSATITIADNDVATLSVAATTQATEDNSDGLFTISSSQVLPDASLISFTITGSATSGVDYNAITSSITLPANQASVTVPVEVIADILVEEDETVILTITGSDNADHTIGTSDQATITITDNDVATLSVFATTQAAEDISDGLFTISTPATSNSATNITVAISGTATSGTDYTAISTTVLLPANSTSVTVPVEVLADAIVEGDETVILNLISTDNPDVSIGSTNSATITIADNDAATLSVTATTQATEDNSDGLFTISSSQALPDASLISFTITGSATSGVDYNAITSSITLPANQASVTVPVEVIADILVEEDETVILTITGSDNADHTIGTSDQATITITDNDVATLSVFATTQAAEDISDGLFTISTPATSNSATNITVAISGTATSGTDYTAISTTVLLPANSTSVTVPLEVLTDAIVEGDETVILNLVSTDNPEVSVGTTNSATNTIADNDIATLSVAATTQAAEDNSDGLFTITSSNPISSNVDISFSMSGSATSDIDYTIVNSPITLDANNLSITIPVIVLSDVLVEGDETVALTLNSTTNNTSVSTGTDNSATILITDNDIADFSLSTSTINLDENGTANFTVVLDSQPLNNVVLTLTSDDTEAISLSETTLTFSNVNWNSPQQVIISGLDDNDLIDENVTITVSVDDVNSDDNFDGLSKSVTATVLDDDLANLVLSSNTLIITEGENNTFSIALSAQPISNVVINISSNNSLATVNQPAITFDNTNWNIAQTITVSAAQDNNLVNETANITLSVDETSDTEFTVVADQTVSVTINDDDTADFTITPDLLGVVEGGSSVFTVVLTAQPESNVNMSLSVNGSGIISYTPAELTFTSGDWNIAQQITVNGLQDNDLNNETATITVSVDNPNSDDNFDGLSKDLTVNVTDDESANFVLSTTEMTVSEGSENSFTIVLSAQPANDVILNIESNDTNAATISSATITFNADNWNIAQSISITGVEDDDLNNESATITISVAAGSDANFVDLTDQTVAITINDNDIANFILTPTSLQINEGNSESFTIVLTAQPSSPITINIQSNNTDAATVSSASITFNSNNWNTEQSITINSIIDANSIDESVIITASINTATSDPDFASVSNKTLDVTIIDNDIADFIISANPIAIDEGAQGNFTVVLTAQPINPVIINLTNNNTGLIAVDPTSSITFNSTNWNIAQTITVTGLQDDDATDEVATITLSVSSGSDNSFINISSKIATINVFDNDTPDLIIVPSSLIVTEGSTASFTVTLNTQPLSNVEVNLASNNTNAASINTTTISFTSANWNTAQEVIVSGVQDDNINDASTFISVSVNNTSSDDSYDGINKTVNVTIIEDDTAPVFTSTPITTINEDELYSYNIITSDADGDIASLTAIQIPSWLSFTDNGDGTARLTGTPLNEHVENSPYSITIRATDRFTTVDHSFSITVINTNDAPVFSSTGITQATEDSPYVYNIQTEDDDNDELTITSITRPTWLSFSSQIDGQAQLSGTPTNDDVGIHAVSLRVFDGTVATFQNFEITVSNVNDAPIITSTHIITATEDSEYSYTVTTRDDDGDAVSIIASTLPTWLTITDNSDGTALITGTPLQQNVGINAVLLRISDNTVTRFSGFEITVSNVNDAPVIIENTTSFTTPEDVALSISFDEIAQDEDDNLNYSSLQVVSQPTNGTTTIDYTLQTVNYEPNTGYSGSDQFTLQISDQDGVQSNVGTISVNVSNEAPNAVNDTYSINEDTPSTFSVLSNDTDLQNNIVPENVTITINPTNGTAVVQNNGTIIYTPATNYFGTDNFTYRVVDIDGYTDQANVSITINPVNDAPSLEDDAETTAEDSPVTINVLDNDTDIDDAIAPSTLQIVDQPLNGAVNISSVDYTITYTPAPDFNGMDSFSYSVSDESGDSSEASVSITVTPVNDAPTPVDDSVQTQEETPVVIYVLTNDTDLENNIDSCSVTVITKPTHGSTLKIGCGRIQYTPNDNFNGDDSFTYQVTDSIGGSATAIVYITVTTVPDSPVAIADSYSTDEDVAVVMEVLLNDYDNDNNINISTLSIASEASNGSLAINNGEITYTPNQDLNGSDSFTYQICDDTELCATATVSITINSVNDAPVAEDDNDSGIGNGSVRTNVASNDYDVEDNLNLNSISIINQPQNGSVQVENGTGYIIYTPETNFDGTDQYTYQICDDEGECAQATVYITITSQDFTPVTVSDYVDLDEDGSVSIYPLENDSSPNSALDPSSLTIIEGPFNGTLDIYNTQLVYIPYDNYYGKDTIVYQICNEASVCAVDTIFIVVNSINDAPAPKDDYLSVIEGETIEVNITLNDTDVESPDLIWARIATYTPSIKGTATMLSDRRTLMYTAPYNCGCSEEVVDYILEDGTGAISGARVHITINKADDNIPKVFSPNGDDFYQYFEIPGIKSGEFTNNELYIFNRWGAQVYYMKNYDNTWDGKSSASSMGSDELPEGTYFYVFKLSSGRVIKGTVYLKK
nr:Ig-like domain-containing protein [uncultured Carboxylicivirga sp.]